MKLRDLSIVHVRDPVEPVPDRFREIIEIGRIVIRPDPQNNAPRQQRAPVSLHERPPDGCLPLPGARRRVYAPPGPEPRPALRAGPALDRQRVDGAQFAPLRHHEHVRLPGSIPPCPHG